jgi:hypothetical protein
LSGARRGYRRALLLGLLTASLAEAAAGQGQPIIFSVTGDVPYDQSELPVLEQHVADHNLFSPSEFLVHVGDILFGDCLEPRYAEVANALLELAVPAFIVPGDNEWNDCDDPDQGWSYWETYLLGLEANFCGTPPLSAQAVRPENFAFTRNGVLFVGINLEGGSVHDDDEWDLRMQQDVDWIVQQFQSRGSQVRAAVIFAQAGPDDDNRDLFFDQFDPAAGLFGKPVLFMHGDGHSWIMNRPFLSQNVLRVQIERGSKPPVQVTVGMDPLDPFTLEREPWDDDPPPLNRPPCVEVSPDLSIDLLEAAVLDGIASDDGVPDPPGNLSTVWRKSSGPGTVSFTSRWTVPTTATFSSAGIYTLRLDANDGEIQRSDSLNVQVLSDEPRLTLDDVFVEEGNAATFTVTLAAATGAPVTVQYHTSNDTALAGLDYPSVSGQLSFSGAVTTRTVTVPTFEEALKEPAESFFLNLTNPVGAILFRSQGAGVILDDDTIYYSLSTSSAGSGSVDVSPAGGVYEEGSVVTLTAVPSALDSLFAGWTGGLTGTTSPATLLMNGNRSVTAHFDVVPGLGVQFRDVATGSAANMATVTTSDDVAAVYDQLYLAAVSSSPRVAVSGVTGLGLAWAPLTDQCDGRDKSMVSLWWALGAPAGPGSVSASLASAPDNAVLTVTRYGGVLRTDPIGSLVSANENGMYGDCDDGDDEDEYSFPLSTLDRGSTVHAALSMRRRRHDPEDPYTERVEVREGSNNEAASLAAQDAEFGFPGTVWIAGEFSSDVDWAGAALEIRRALEPQASFTLSTSSGAGGSVSPSGGSFDAGSLLSLEAIPDSGHAFTGWGGALTGSSSPALLLLDADRAVTAGFSPVYDLEVATSGAGSVSVDPTPGPYLEGSRVDLLATPAAGSALGWSGHVSGSTNPQSLLMDADKQVTATFTPLHDVSVSTTGSGSVSIAPAAGPYLQGTVLTLSASPGPGFAFTGWSGDLSGSQNPAQLILDDDQAVGATFTRLYDVSVDAGSGGSVQVAPPGSPQLEGTVLTLTAIPDPGFAFTGWSGDLSGTQSPTTLVVTANRSVSAAFTALHDVSVQTTAGGNVALAPEDGPYLEGSVVMLTAMPEDGFDFAMWQGDLSGPENPASLTLDEDKSVVAVFQAPEPAELVLRGAALALLGALTRRRRRREARTS